jgi:hypothetical protein
MLSSDYRGYFVQVHVYAWLKSGFSCTLLGFLNWNLRTGVKAQLGGRVGGKTRQMAGGTRSKSRGEHVNRSRIWSCITVPSVSIYIRCYVAATKLEVERSCRSWDTKDSRIQLHSTQENMSISPASQIASPASPLHIWYLRDTLV